MHHMKLQYVLELVDRSKDSHRSAEYLKLNPAGRIPTLVVNDQAIFESFAICIHLCEQHPENGLIPEIGNPLRPMFFQWLAFLNNTLQAELMVRYYPHRHTNDENTIKNVVAAQDKRIAEALSIVNDQLGGKSYILGENISACDYFLFMLSEWSLPVQQSPLTFENLASYLKKMCANTSVRAVSELEGIDLTPFENNV